MLLSTIQNAQNLPTRVFVSVVDNNYYMFPNVTSEISIGLLIHFPEIEVDVTCATS